MQKKPTITKKVTKTVSKVSTSKKLSPKGTTSTTTSKTQQQQIQTSTVQQSQQQQQQRPLQSSTRISVQSNVNRSLPTTNAARRSIQISSTSSTQIRVNRSSVSNTSQNKNQRKIYDDDEPINIENIEQLQQKKEGQNLEIEKMLKMKIRARFSDITLKNEEQKLPVMVQICTQDDEEKEDQQEQTNLNDQEQQQQEEEQKENVKEMVKQEQSQTEEKELDRAPIDLICVIDRSGSMTGEKIELVKKTLLYLVEELLGEKDRLCLVQFDHAAQRLTKLLRVTEKNKEFLLKTIKAIQPAGCTDIAAGMKIAVNQIGDRKYKNPVSSIFLLSDGIDYEAKAQVNTLIMKTKKQTCEKNPFTIQSFGYGRDHDSNLMDHIAKLRDGSFYYIEKLDQVDEAFVNALAELFSVICQNVSIIVSLCDEVYQKNLFKADSLQISKVFGDMWNQVKDKTEFKINMQQLIKGISKEYMLELNIPTLEQLLKKPIQDIDRHNLVLKAEFKAEKTEQNQQDQNNNICLKSEFHLNFFEEEMEDREEDGEVMENYYRVKGAEMIGECITKADQGDLESGNQILESFVNEVEANPKLKKSEKIQKIVTDLKEAKSIMSNKQEYHSKKGKMINIKGGHMNQKAQIMSMEEDEDDFDMMDQGQFQKKKKGGYQNSLQMKMVQKCKMKKKM